MTLPGFDRARRPRLGLFALALLTALAGPAAATALPLDASAGPGDLLDAAPRHLEIRFSERVDDVATDLDVFDLQGESVRAGPAERVAPDRLRIPLAPLDAGSYSVAWRTLSQDGHVARGAYFFHVEQAAVRSGAGVVEVGAEVYDHRHAESATRAAHVATLVLVVGVLLASRALPALLRLAPPFALASSVTALLSTYYVADRAALAAHEALLATEAASLAARALLLALVAALALRAGTRARPRAATLAALPALLLAAVSAQAGVPGAALAPALAAATLHLFAAAALVAALTPVALASAPVPARVAWIAAATAAGALGAAAFHLDDAGRLAASAYGGALLLETALLALLGLALAVPRLARRAPRAAPMGALAALVALGVASAAAPPAALVAEAEPVGPLVLEHASATTHALLTLEPHPLTPQEQTFLVQLHPLVRGGIPPETRVTLGFSPEDAGEAPTRVAPERTGPAEWRLRGAFLDAPGAWRVELTIERPDEVARASFLVVVSSQGEPP